MDAATRVMVAQLTSTLVVPGAVTLALALLPLRIWRREGARPQVSALALGGGLLAGLLAILGVPEGYPPSDTVDWLILLPVPAALGMSLFKGDRVFAALGALVGWMGLGGAMVLWPLWSQEAPPLAPLLGWLALGGIGALGPLMARQKEAPGPALFAAVSLWALGAAGVVGLGGSALVAQLLGMVAAVNGLLAILSRLLPALTPGVGALGASAALLGALLLYGYFYGELSPLAAVLAMLAGVGAAVTARGHGQLRPLLAGLAVVGLFVGGAVGLAATSFGLPDPQEAAAPEGDEDDNYGYGDEHQQGEGAPAAEPYAPY